MSALAAADGKPLWAAALTGQYDFWSPPVATGGWVYVNGLESGGTTYAIIGGTGAVRWREDTFDGSGGSVAVADGVVYEAEACDQLSAFEAPTLVLLWYAHSGCTGGGGSTPSVYRGLVWQRDWASGNVIVDTSGHAQGSFAADTPPSFHDGVAFYMSKKTLTAVEIDTKKVKWTFTGDGMLCTSAAIAGRGHQVFVGSASGLVYELDEETGAIRSMDDAGAPVTCGSEKASMAIGGNHLVVSAGTKLIAY
jgi:outer membrane protein assembly factor BamB